MMTDIEHAAERERLSALMKQAYEQSVSHFTSVSMLCFHDGEHFGYLTAGMEVQALVPAFSDAWWKLARPCFLEVL
jgi:hypothetical protein